MLTKKCAMAALASLSLFATVSTANADILKIGSETVYPPFEYLDPTTGRYAGFDIDLIDAIAKKANLEPKIYSMGLDALIPALMSDTIDVAISALTITPERAQKVDFTKPYYESGLTIMTHRDHVGKIKGTKDLEGKTLCVEIGSSGGLFSAKILGVKLRTFNSATEAFMEIDQRGCYAMINDKPVNEFFLASKQAKSMNLAEVNVILSEDNYGFAVKKGNAQLKARLEKALDDVIADGTYEKIYNKWFGPMMKK